ncbi:FAD linked oxidase domain protein [Thiorhodococcus drewsii AZ1]|uniref:FAD linked oxidase domain protein n=1 Tax=Thiorhodococcus drewsii AZ1 TaxID=765913 RepID=G2E5T3_9GAMM|nr:FAD-binding protein [Thiorhodococcus drewsii]EGV28578.1 FAD linked oxidase domain protein [Thiorhodococcus drewsii AZ1]
MSAPQLLSWGQYPPFPQTPHPCHWREMLPETLDALVRAHGSTLPFGNGRSYGDSCLAASDRVMHLRHLDRFIQANWTTGILTAEAGVTLQEILALAIPHGWFLSVTPGTQLITLGGAIANDVHGKNHHVRGTFGRHVRRFGLLRSQEGRLVCSPQDNAELFAATIGGLGLTGLIEWAEIQLLPIRSSQIDGQVERFETLAEFFTLSDELDRRHEYGVAWIDCAASGRTTGRGVYMAGDFATEGALEVADPARLGIPLTPPISLINGLSLRAFNAVYWRKHPRTRQAQRLGYAPFFYPLDGIHQWNRLYGPKGFQQYQCLIPHGEAEPAIHALLSAIAASGTGSFLAVLKRCGTIASPGLLSFPAPGTTLALDFPQSERLDTYLFPRLDAIVREAGGRLYPAKDAHMRGEDFRHGYPAWERLEALRDPALNSRFWTRVTT